MKILAIIAITSCLFPLPSALLAEDAPATKDYVILKVGNEDVKKSEIEEVWKSIFPGNNPPAFESVDPKVKDNVLRGVASEHVLLKEAEKSGIQNSEAVKARLATVERQVVIQEFLKEKTKDLVTDDKLKAAYEEHVKENAGEEEVRARHILVKTEADAKDIEKKLKKGGDFEKLAREKSQDKGSKASGGELGWFTADKMVPEFSKAAFSLKKGEISDPVKTDFGWHVIQVEDRRKSAPPSFDDSKEALRQEVGSNAVNEYVEGLMKGVKITEVDAGGHEKDLPPAADKSKSDSKPAASAKPAEPVKDPN